jgi:hypothetical protein
MQRQSEAPTLAESGQWHPAPVHVHFPAGQFVKEQLAPSPHASTHPPAEHSTLHVAPLGHDVLQSPLEHWIVHMPSPQ